ncbi:MAG: NAD(P)H-hydrate dehydratase [Bacteroidaceae bacterium]|nr:NAD(P)H-hydrate dehydratase [Bacteroidaceae bacterium]
MKIFPTSAIRQLDAYTIEHEPIDSLALMERAANALAKEIMSQWPDKEDTRFVIFAGPGNNGGDALAVARLLSEQGYKPVVYLFNTTGSLSADCEANRDLLTIADGVEFYEVTKQFAPPQISEDDVIIDGLFGSGLNRPLTGGFASLVRFINAVEATVVSIDIPSGLMGEDNTSNVMENVVHADYTLTFQFPKLAFLFAENEQYVGAWKVLDIGLDKEGIRQTYTPFELGDSRKMRYQLKIRSRFAHKGDFGRALLVAGQQGMAGASVLAARACLRSGVGLLTVHVPLCNNTIVQTSVPEAMTSLDYNEFCFAEAPDLAPYQAIGVGPGLGQAECTQQALYSLLTHSDVPMVLDADALNLIGENHTYLRRLPKGSIITPHPGEMDRLVGKCHNSYERLSKAMNLAQTCGLYIILKGAYTAVLSPDGSCWFNVTGNPGMATGGCGDVLTGVILALLAQGYDADTASKLGVCVHGLAGDLAARDKGEIALTASDVVDNLYKAWKALE